MNTAITENMAVAEVLDIWAKAAKDLRWWLYKENLLCAVGYGTVSQELTFARVAITGAELPRMLENTVPALPADWTMNVSDFAAHKMPLKFLRGEQLLLEVDVLLDAEHPELDEIRKKCRRAQKLAHKLPFLAFLEKKAQQKAFRALVSEAAKSEGKGEWVWDGFTDKAGALHPGAWMRETVTITCRDGEYPVPAEYRTFLREVYCDYENGLFDGLGCGLTVEDKNNLREHQQHCREALAFVEQLSQDFGLRYYLLAGSVLGPVRHGGFIPWDDDIDIGIRVEDLARFEALVEEHLPQRLPKGFSLKKPGANSDYPRMFSKICYEGRCCMDLWPLIPTQIDGLRAKFLWKFGKFITKVHYKKIGYKVTRFKKIVALVDPFLSDKLVMALARANERAFLSKMSKKPDAYINLYSIYTRHKETIPLEWLDTEARLPFDGLEVPVVGCTHDYLTHLYGNYMGKPAPWKRASRHVERF